MTREEAKQAAGQKAVEHIKPNMIIGLGTGSTILYFIEALIKASPRGIKCVASSRASAEQALRGGLPLFDLDSVPRIDLTVDGADEIDKKKRMIKGGGGAHMREKILASASERLLIIVDETKLVDSVGHAKLPVEILPFGAKTTQKHIEKLNLNGHWRLQKDGKLFLTENGNYLFDIHFLSPPPNPEQIQEQLLHIPGLLDTGFFFGYAPEVLVGYQDGTTNSNLS